MENQSNSDSRQSDRSAGRRTGLIVFVLLGLCALAAIVVGVSGVIGVGEYFTADLLPSIEAQGTLTAAVMATAEAESVQRLTATAEARQAKTATAVAAVTAMAEARQAKTATAVAAVTATVISAEDLVARASNWQTQFSERFDTNDHGWPEGSSESEFAVSEVRFEQDRYLIQTEAKQGSALRYAPTVDAVLRIRDFYLSVTAQQLEGPVSASHGVAFRERLGDFYYFVVDDDGFFFFGLWMDEEWTTLIEHTQTEAFAPGESNRITVVGEGPNFAFFVNDRFVAHAHDTNLTIGTVALTVGLGSAGESSLIAFDDLELRSP